MHTLDSLAAAVQLYNQNHSLQTDIYIRDVFCIFALINQTTATAKMFTLFLPDYIY